MKITTSKGRVIHEQPGELAGADLRGLKLLGADFQQSSLVESDFSGAILTGANFMEANLTKARLDDCVMAGVHLMETALDGASLRRADLYWANAFMMSFRGVDLTEAKLNGADLKECDFTDAILTGADFGLDNLGGGTMIQGATFVGAVLNRVIWTGAEYDSSTIFPTDFDPHQHGLVLKQS